MNKFRFELDSQGVQSLLKNEEMRGLLETMASERAPKGCEATVRVHKKRAVAYIHPLTKEAYKDNLKNNTLLKALRR